MLRASIDTVCRWLAAGVPGVLAVPVNPELRGEFRTHARTLPEPRLCVVRPEFAAAAAGAGPPSSRSRATSM